MIQPAFHMEPMQAPQAVPAAQPMPAAAGPRPASIDMELYVRKHRELRAKQDEIEERHKAELKPYKEALSQIEIALLGQLQAANMNSVKTPAGTCYLSTRRSVTIADPAVFRAWVEANERPDFYENRVAKEALDTYLAEGGALPPGLKVSADTKVNVRK